MKRFSRTIQVLRRFGLPLLARELKEQASRKRTYFFRVVFATAIYTAVYLQYGNLIQQSSNSPFAALGYGSALFTAIVGALSLGIYVLMPAITCGAIAAERERNTLGTLLLTRLGPRTILFEKLLSRLVPMFSFLLLAMPLLAFAYSLGGVSDALLLSSMLLLALQCVEVGAFALLCSAYASSTVSAFFMTYLLGVFFLGLVPACICPIGYFAAVPAGASMPGIGAQSATGDFGITMFQSAYLLLTTALFLLLAERCLINRAIVPPRNSLLEIFRKLDRFYNQLNEVTGGLVLVRDKNLLPGDKPLAWRETAKKSLGSIRYLFRVLVTIETPLLFILVLEHTSPNPGGDRRLSAGLVASVWHLAILLVAGKSASLITSERSRQTLDVLLTAPLEGREILRQSFRGVVQLMGVMAVPFATIFAFVVYWETGSWSRLSIEWQGSYLVWSLLSVAIYLPLVAWISYAIGLAIHKQSRAIILSLLVVFLWIYVPILAAPGWHAADDRGLHVLFPAWLVIGNEWRTVAFSDAMLHFLIYGALLWGVRAWCLGRADALLGRCGPVERWWLPWRRNQRQPAAST